MNKVTEEEIKYDIHKTSHISVCELCSQSTISHPSSIMGTRGTNKDGGLLHRCRLETTTSAVSVLILQQLQQLLLLQRE